MMYVHSDECESFYLLHINEMFLITLENAYVSLICDLISPRSHTLGDRCDLICVEIKGGVHLI